MTRMKKLFFAGSGMITPIGANSEMTAASVKAGVSTYGLSKFHYSFQAIKMASVPDEALPNLDDDANCHALNTRQQRMLRLAHCALEQFSPELISHVPLFLAGPEPMPDKVPPVRSSFLTCINSQTRLDIDMENSKVFPLGRAATFYALQSAFEYLESSNKGFALVGGVDTFQDFLLLDELASGGRIQTAVNTADAFVPGEAAGFILLTKDPSFTQNGTIFYPGIAEEEGHRYSDEVYSGEGLSKAISLALDNSEFNQIETVYSSFNGESFAAKEFGVSCVRNTPLHNSSLEHLHPADCFGDLGGATGVILLTLAAMNANQFKLVYGSSDCKFRGAACVC